MFVRRDNVLYRRNTRPDGPELLLAVHAYLRSTILQQLHDMPTARHLGISRTYEPVHQPFFWPGLYRFVRATSVIATSVSAARHQHRLMSEQYSRSTSR